MTDTAPQKKMKHPAKQFAIPADIRALGNYAHSIIDGMRAEHRKRMGRSRSAAAQ
jgi:hypothetical protein